MNFLEIPGKSWTKWGDRSGRASRSEYWFNVLWLWLIVILFTLILPLFAIAEGIIVIYLTSAILMLPVAIRRLHDINASGWWILIHLIPWFGFLMYIVFLRKGTDGPNKYGEDPTSDIETKQQNAPDESSRRTRYSRR